ncbi:MlaD family protein [uncultured Dokdonia sp.]|uniref:MlaD family protein n=1 Tax=uncultured Dokdonia sp. TaxID=575653 RepID=UPI00261A9021|nr:MlaD family protein [uncultured Dokdonia sp.]
MEKSSKNKVQLGVFVIVGTLLLVIVLYLIGNRQNIFSNNIKINTKFTNVNGLQLGNNVRYSGIDIGTVHAIKMQSDTIILVEMLLKESMTKFLKKDAVATIGSDGLVGNMIVNIIPREGESPLVISGDTIESYSRISTDNMLTTLNATNQNLELLSSDLLKVTTEILHGGGTITSLLKDKEISNDLKSTITNLKTSTANISLMTRELSKNLERIDMEHSVAGVLLTDSIQGQKVKTMIQNVEIASQDIQKVTASLDTIMTRIVNGKGSLHHLTTDEILVKNIDSTMQHIKEGTAKFNENMEALKHSIFFRRYFKKQEKETLKRKQEEKKEND